jgi:putative DNA primase/helicase
MPEHDDWHGEQTTLSAARLCCHYGLPPHKTFELLLDEYNDRCVPPWEPPDLAHKVAEAYAFAKANGMIGQALPDFNPQKRQALTDMIEANQSRFPVENADDESEPEPTDDHEAEAKQLDMRCALMSQDDMGFAKRLKLRYGNVLQFHNKSWYYYNKRYWEERQDAPIKLLDRVTNQIKTKEIKYIDTDYQKEFLKWADNLGSAPKVEGAIRLAKSLLNKNDPFEIPCSSIINFHNGTLELTTGKLRQHQSSDNFLYCLPYDYTPDARSGAWDQYLSTVFMGNEELIRYVQNLIGCTLLSNTDNEFSVWLSGDGSNGKTTFTETIAHALGSLAQQIPNDLFLTKKYGQNHPTEIARLHQVKFATCSDISLNSKLDEGTFKRLVSTGKATGRFMHRDFFDFTMTHKFWISVNNLPSVYDESYGLWRRMIVIPFNKKFTPQERDDTIKARLKEQIDGVWAWMVRGAMDFYHSGLMEPPGSVKEAVEQWKSTEDWWTNFLADECIVAEHKKVPSSMLYDEFLDWAKRNSSPHISHTSFSKRVAQAGFGKYKSNGVNVFKGIGIKHGFDDEGESGGL